MSSLSGLSERLGSKDGKKEKEKDSNDLQIQGALVQRVVIVQRDQKGYGLTVSGDNPVYVQSVKDDGAAARAGVQKGDIIIKVNGTLVSNSNHLEVVEMIKATSYVALTLLGKQNGGGGGRLPSTNQSAEMGGTAPVRHPDSLHDQISAPSQDASKDQELQRRKIATIRMMYEKASNDYMKIRQELAKNPNAMALRTSLAEVEKMLKTLGQQLYDLTGVPAESQATVPSSGGIKSPGAYKHSKAHSMDSGVGEGIQDVGLPPKRPNATPWLPGGPSHKHTRSEPEQLMSGATLVAEDKDKITRTHSDNRKNCTEFVSEMRETRGSSGDPERFRTASLPNNVFNNPDEASPTGTPPSGRNSWIDQASDFGVMKSPGGSLLTTPAGMHIVSPNQVQVAEVITMDDEEFTDEEHLEEHGPFSDLNRLKSKPAHLAVFLHYLISNSDPSPLLFYLVSESYSLGSMKDMKKWAYEIHSTFLREKAPLRVNTINDEIVMNVDFILQNRIDKEDQMRSIFAEARHMAQKEISEMLADFRTKRSLGLGSLFGAHELYDENMDGQTQLKIIEKYLEPHWKRFMEIESSEVTDKDQAMAAALATFMKQVGISPPAVGKTSSGGLDRSLSFVSKDRDRKAFRFSKQPKKPHQIKGHNFAPQHYYSVTHCNHCQTVIWGIGFQGEQCLNCEYNVHKSCADQVNDPCPGSRKKLSSGGRKQSMLDKIIRKPSVNSPSAIREATGRHEELMGVVLPHTSPPVLEEERPDQLGRNRYSGDMSSSAMSQSMIATGQEVRDSQPISPNRSRSPEPPPDGSDVQVDDHTIKSLNSKTSSINSIAGSTDTSRTSGGADAFQDLPSVPQHPPWTADGDSDFDEGDHTLERSIDAKQLNKMKVKEKKRQEVLNELFYTEKSHVRTLKVMHNIYHVPFKNAEWLSDDFVNLLFPNMEEVISMHDSLNQAFKKLKKQNPVIGDIGPTLMARFNGEAGDEVAKTAAIFCRQQKFALESLNYKKKKDTKFMALHREASSNILCKRLELKDQLVTEMQRLTKYPMLIDNLKKYTNPKSEEYKTLEMVTIQVESILDKVNQAVREYENYFKLQYYQQHLDKRHIENLSMLQEYKNIDLTKHTLVHYGPLTWRIGKTKEFIMEVLLLEDVLVILQPSENNKMVLRCQSSTIGQSDQKVTHSPIIKLSNLLIRDVATDKNAFFLIYTSAVGPQIYEFAAMSTDEQKRWYKFIGEAIRQQRPSINDPNPSFTSQLPDLRTTTTSLPKQDEEDSSEDRTDDDDQPSRRRSKGAKRIDVLTDKMEHLKVLEPTLIQPDQVIISGTVVEQAESVTHRDPQSELVHQQKLIDQAMSRKLQVIRDMMQAGSGQNKDDSNGFKQAAAEGSTEGEKSAQQVLLAAIVQAGKLTTLLNQALSTRPDAGVDDEEPITPTPAGLNPTVSMATAIQNEESSVIDPEALKGETDMARGSVRLKDDELVVNLPAKQLQAITQSLDQNLSSMMEMLAMQSKEEERLKEELKETQIQLELAGGLSSTTTRDTRSRQRDSRPSSFISVESSTSELGDDAGATETSGTTSGDDTVVISSIREVNMATANVEVLHLEDVLTGESNVDVYDVDEETVIIPGEDDRALHDEQPRPATNTSESAPASKSASSEQEEEFLDAESNLTDSNANVDASSVDTELVEGCNDISIDNNFITATI